MPDYPRLASFLGKMDASTSEAVFVADVLPYLTEIWLSHYTSSLRDWDIVQVTLGEFSYLFDIIPSRLIAAWGISRGRHAGARDKSRMKGHPQSAGPRYHRGHAIPHTLGGSTDINLIAQLGAVNVGAFRPLERQAVATPGSLYFTYWIYGQSASQTPTAVEQGLLVPGCREDIRRHTN
jgi:hypothetical protein